MGLGSKVLDLQLNVCLTNRLAHGHNEQDCRGGLQGWNLEIVIIIIIIIIIVITIIMVIVIVIEQSA